LMTRFAVSFDEIVNDEGVLSKATNPKSSWSWERKWQSCAHSQIRGLHAICDIGLLNGNINVIKRMKEDQLERSIFVPMALAMARGIITTVIG
jgi:hypothetical protein